MADAQATAILIAGMHRSGTSALAGALGKLGIPLGERLLAAGNDNPKGYWEHQDFVAVHQRLLTALGSRWDDVRPLPPGWTTGDAARQAMESLERLVARDFRGKALWAAKDPRLCRFLPLWIEVLHRGNIRPLVLLMVREPTEVAASIEARNHWRRPIGEMLWLRYVTEAEAASRDVARAVVTYADLLAEPVSVVRRVLRELGVLCEWSASRLKDVKGFVDIADRHHVQQPTGKAANKFESIAQGIYGSLVSVAHGEGAWSQVQKGAAEFERYWQQDCAAAEALAGMAEKLASDVESEWVENKLLSSKLTAQVRWSNEAQARIEILQTENAELSSRLNAQVRWSDEAQAHIESLQAESADLSSKLAAQIRWSEEAQANREALRAKEAELTFKLAKEVGLQEEAQARCDQLSAEGAELESKLAAQTRSLEEVRVERNVLRRDMDDLSAKLRRTVSEGARARQVLAAQLQESANTRESLAAELGSANQQRVLLETQLGAVYHSTSWKLTRPLRVMARMFRPKAGRLNRYDEGRP